MPQISKIRIANFSYNDGKRLIADELFDSGDTLIDSIDLKTKTASLLTC